MVKSVPFVPFPLDKAYRHARDMGLVGLGERISKLFPQLTLYLYQAEFPFEEREYVSIAILSGIFWFAILFGIFIFLFFIAIVPPNFLLITSISSFAIGALAFLYVITFPKIIVTRRVRELEKNLLFALRHLLIQVKSGIALFDSMVSVSKANYGLVSNEFNDAIRRISTGVRDVDALEELALKNPSIYFRRSLWQITNALRAGADIAATLESIITNLSNEQRILVRKYGSQLNPLAFMYMMFGVIVPSLGIAMLTSLSSFAGFEIQQIFFWAIIAFLVIFKFNFLGIVKSRRPSVEVYV